MQTVGGGLLRSVGSGSYLGRGWAVETIPLVVYPAPDAVKMGFGSGYPVTYLVDVSANSGSSNRTHPSFTYYTEPLSGAKIGDQAGKSLAWTMATR